MKNILILLFALFAVALKADDRTVPGRTLSVTPQNALIHLPEFRKRSYKVFIQDEKGIWQPIEVRNALVSSFSKHPQIWNDWENQKLLRDTMSYALFVRDFAKNVKVRVEPCYRFRNVEIRPVSYGIDYKRVKGGIEFELTDASQKVSVEFDGDRAENLFLFPDLPDVDKPAQDVPDVLYYGAGQHDAGRIVMKSNQTLYLDEGAFVYGYVVGKGIENVRIAGRGILCGAKETHCDERRTQLINFEYCRNVEISGVTLIDSPAWTIRLKNSQDLLVDNVKQISWILNSDGLDVCNSREVRVRNCFFRNYDDCITIKNQELAKMGCEDVLVENCRSAPMWFLAARSAERLVYLARIISGMCLLEIVSYWRHLHCMIARRGMMAGEEDVRLLMHVLAYTRGLAEVDGCLTFYSRIYRLRTCMADDQLLWR